MTINGLYNIWYDGNRNDINFINTCYNMLGCVKCNTTEDRRKWNDLREGIRYAMEDWLYDHN